MITVCLCHAFLFASHPIYVKQVALLHENEIDCPMPTCTFDASHGRAHHFMSQKLKQDIKRGINFCEQVTTLHSSTLLQLIQLYGHVIARMFIIYINLF